MLKKRIKNIITATVMMVGVIVGCAYLSRTELPSYVDPLQDVVCIEAEEVPLASKPTVTTKTTTKTTKTNVKLKKAAKKSYTKVLPSTVKKTTKTKTSSNKTVKTETTVRTSVTEKYVKKSYQKKVTKKVTTTVKTTTTIKTVKKTVTQSQQTVQPTTPYEKSVDLLAPKMKENVRNAFKELGFKITVNPTASYAGYFNAANREIILKAENDTVYHELGHFVAFIANNADKSSSFITVYNNEKSRYTGTNKSYVIQNSSEYFAESVKDYVLSPTVLKTQRPATYQEIEKAFNKVTPSEVSRLKVIYSFIW